MCATGSADQTVNYSSAPFPLASNHLPVRYYNLRSSISSHRRRKAGQTLPRLEYKGHSDRAIDEIVLEKSDWESTANRIPPRWSYLCWAIPIVSYLSHPRMYGGLWQHRFNSINREVDATGNHGFLNLRVVSTVHRSRLDAREKKTYLLKDSRTSTTEWSNYRGLASTQRSRWSIYLVVKSISYHAHSLNVLRTASGRPTPARLIQ